MCCKDNGLQAGGTYFVDRYGFDGRRKASEDGSLSGGSLSNIPLKHVSHVNIGDLGDWDFGLLDGGFDGYGAELGSGDRGERSIELRILVQAHLEELIGVIPSLLVSLQRSKYMLLVFLAWPRQKH